MKKVLIFTNFPAPYRIPFFNALSDFVCLYVAFYKETLAGRKWSQNREDWKFNEVPVLRKGSRFARPMVEMPLDCIVSLDNGLDNFYGNLWLRHHAQRNGVPFVGWVGHNVVGIRKSSVLLRLFREFWFRLFYKSVSKYLCYSNDSRNFVLAYRPGARTFVGGQVFPRNLINGGGDIPFRTYRGDERCIVISYIGALNSRKGVMDLIDVFSEINTPSIILQIAGEGELAPSVEAASEVDRRINYISYVDGRRKHDFFMCTDILVVPSYEEPWGHVVTEALAYGIPIISSSAVGARQTLTSGDKVFPVGHVGALKSALIRQIEEFPENNVSYLDDRRKNAKTDASNEALQVVKFLFETNE